MMSNSRRIILFRSKDDPDPYIEAVEEMGAEAMCVPVLSFSFLNQRLLQDHLEHRDRYAGLIATSPRVGEALDRVFECAEEAADAWQGAPAYAVGPKTAKRLKDIGLRPRGMDAGTARTLADRILEDAPDAPLLFLCGNRRRDELPDRLTAGGVPFEELTVYRTETRSTLDVPDVGEGDWLVFFSPSGVEAVQNASSVDPADFRVATMGPTTAGAVEAAGWSVDAVAAEPSPDGVVGAIEEMLTEE